MGPLETVHHDGFLAAALHARADVQVAIERHQQRRTRRGSRGEIGALELQQTPNHLARAPDDGGAEDDEAMD